MLSNLNINIFALKEAKEKKRMEQEKVVWFNLEFNEGFLFFPKFLFIFDIIDIKKNNRSY